MLRREKDLFERFCEFQGQVRMLSVYWRLFLVKKFNQDMETMARESLNEDGSKNVEMIRVKGLQLIERLKSDIFDAKYHVAFEIVYPTHKVREKKKKRDASNRKVLNRFKTSSISSKVPGVAGDESGASERSSSPRARKFNGNENSPELRSRRGTMAPQ